MTIMTRTKVNSKGIYITSVMREMATKQNKKTQTRVRRLMGRTRHIIPKHLFGERWNTLNVNQTCVERVMGKMKVYNNQTSVRREMG